LCQFFCQKYFLKHNIGPWTQIRCIHATKISSGLAFEVKLLTYFVRVPNFAGIVEDGNDPGVDVMIPILGEKNSV
jgi:hypothetical protein